jgi:DNA-binding response OmpR family regulator
MFKDRFYDIIIHNNLLLVKSDRRPKYEILIVEDELRLADTLRQLMHENKYTVDVVNDGENGLFYALTDVYDIIILDIMLPKLDGFEVARRLRSKKIKTPIIMLTAKDEVDDKVHGLDCGADDYLTKRLLPENCLQE